jgi:hypothetical protein
MKGQIAGVLGSHVDSTGNTRLKSSSFTLYIEAVLPNGDVVPGFAKSNNCSLSKYGV